jgi:hypothetical protein
MGLDMYAYTVKAAEVGDQQVDINLNSVTPVDREFAYWRKFNHLHGWMERLYRQKGGESECFNCNTVRLTVEDINRLEADLNAKLAGTRDNLQATSGFFFGGDEWYEGDEESLRRFIQNSRDALAGGLAVIYDSWW